MVWRVTRIAGTSQPALHEGDVLTEDPVLLEADAELVVDLAGTRSQIFGPASVAFGADGVCLLGRGLFALTRVSGSPAAASAPLGSRGRGGRLALPDRVVSVGGGGTVVGRARAAGSEVEVLSGAARVDPPGRMLRAGQRLSARGAGVQASQTRGGRLDAHVAALRALPEAPAGASLDGGARARLMDALGQLQGDEGEPQPSPKDALSRRRGLAAQAAARIRARAALADALDAYRAASLLSPGGRDEELIGRATARLQSQKH